MISYIPLLWVCYGFWSGLLGSRRNAARFARSNRTSCPELDFLSSALDHTSYHISFISSSFYFPVFKNTLAKQTQTTIIIHEDTISRLHFFLKRKIKRSLTCTFGHSSVGACMYSIYTPISYNVVYACFNKEQDVSTARRGVNRPCCDYIFVHFHNFHHFSPLICLQLCLSLFSLIAAFFHYSTPVD